MLRAAALRAVRARVPGTLVRARLCHRGEGFAYVLTVLGHDGKVTHVIVDAVKGTVVGERSAERCLRLLVVEDDPDLDRRLRPR